jgi:adenylate kinase family enzyme
MESPMEPCRVLVMGASGSGTTTLGRALANRWAVPHADADDYFWQPTTPPYVDQRRVDERLRLMQEMFLPRDAWVLSGSVMGWGDPLVPLLDAVVFCSLSQEVRLERLQAREVVRYGSRIAPGGDRAEAFAAFLTWATGYEDPAFEGRNRAVHEEWLAALDVPVLRVDTSRPTAELVRGLADAV